MFTKLDIFTKQSFAAISGGNCPVAINRVKGLDTLGFMHYHVFNELAIIVDGSGIYNCEGKEYSLRPGDIFLLPPGMKHQYVEQYHLEVANFMWEADELQWPPGSLEQMPGYLAFFKLEPQTRHRYNFERRLTLTPDQLSEVMLLHERIRRELNRRANGFSFLVCCILGELMVAISRFYAANSTQTGSEHSDLLRLEKIISFLNHHYMRSISRREVAELAGMSESTFYRKFKESMGESLSEYLVRLRLAYAQKLLCSSDLAMTEISSQCGFSDSNYFGFQFKKHFGTSPYQYRLQKSKQSN